MLFISSLPFEMPVYLVGKSLLLMGRFHYCFHFPFARNERITAGGYLKFAERSGANLGRGERSEPSQIPAC
jgi:hypothetical protein